MRAIGFPIMKISVYKMDLLGAVRRYENTRKRGKNENHRYGSNSRKSRHSL